MKRLVLCCDGTWNRADQAVPTNVEKFRREVAPVSPDGVRQLVRHHDGVGNGGWLEHLAGGAFGAGLSTIVQDVYRDVVANFVPGDELFFLGFSRGAFTARSVIGLIRNCGVLRPEHSDRVGEAYALYRKRTEQSRPDAPAAARFREAYSYETRIRFVGVWDTVGALGIPFSGLRLATVVNRPWQFHDTKLSSTVDAAFQALAVDERRRPYEPAVWDPPDDDRPRRQVWFAGVHSDVGGGYREHGLSDVTLRWMAARAHECGLAFREDSPLPPLAPGNRSPRFDDTVTPLAAGDLHDSMNWAYRLWPYPRPIGGTDEEAEAVASSALQRTRRDPRYRPEELMRFLARRDRRLETVACDDATAPI